LLRQPLQQITLINTTGTTTTANAERQATATAGCAAISAVTDDNETQCGNAAQMAGNERL
jgi:hypothetical protein